MRENEHINGLVQEIRNSIALAMDLRLSCTNASMSSSQYIQINKG